MKKEASILIKAVFNITLGIVLILTGILLPGKWLFTNHSKMYDEINLSKFSGKVYQFDEIKIYPQILVEDRDGFQTALKSQNKNNVFIYDNDINRNISVEIYTPDTLIRGKFFRSKKNYGAIESGQYKLSFQDKVIKIYRTPSPIWYILDFVIALILIIWGIDRIMANLDKI